MTAVSTRQKQAVANLNDEVTIDRRSGRDRRQLADRRKENIPVEVDRRKEQRRKVQRRRQIDPTTCERDYTPEEIEFMIALDEYKRSSGRMFPTCSEILEVLKKLGYEKRPQSSDVSDESQASETNDEQPSAEQGSAAELCPHCGKPLTVRKEDG